MKNYNRDGWTDTAWQDLEKAREGLYWAGLEIDAYIGSGGGSFGPKELDAIIRATSAALNRMAIVRSQYDD